MEESLQFHQPGWILVGAVVSVFVVIGLWRWNKRRAADLAKLAHAQSLSKLTESVSDRRRNIKQWLWLVAVFLLFVTAARPQFGFEWREVKRRGIDLVFAVDTSRSMLAEDVVPNRLERSKLAIIDFVDKLEGDRVGLIPFAGNAFALCPLTLDYGAFRQSLDALNTEIIPHLGTDVASAVREANRLFDVEGNNHRILILITDGEDLQGAVSEALDQAEEKGMTIHTVGVGEPSGALIPIPGPDGGQDFVRDESGQPVRTALDEETLRKMAEATGGIYAPLGRSGEGLSTIYQEKLRLVPKSELNQRLDRIPLERFEWPLTMAIVLLLVEFLLGDRRRARRKKEPLISVGRRGVQQAAVVLAAGFCQILNAQEAVMPPPMERVSKGEVEMDDPRKVYNAGTSAYEAGEFEQAEEALGTSLQSTNDLMLQQRSYYNLGNTRYRRGQQILEENPEKALQKWEEAIKAYDDALALNAEDEDAIFNREFVQRKLEELKEQQENQDQQKQGDQPQENQDQQKQGDQPQENQDQQKQGDQPQENQDQQKQNEQQQESDQNQSQQDKDGDGKKSDEEETEDKQPDGSGGEKADEEKETPAAGETEKQEQEQPKDHPMNDQAGESKRGKPDEPKSGESTGGEPKEDEKGPPENPKGDRAQPEDSAKQDQQPAQPQPSGSGEPVDEQSEGQPGAGTGQPGERREPGEMSEEEAVQLLEALKNDERSVIPLPNARAYRQTNPNNTTRGKTW